MRDTLLNVRRTRVYEKHADFFATARKQSHALDFHRADVLRLAMFGSRFDADFIGGICAAGVLEHFIDRFCWLSFCCCRVSHPVTVDSLRS